MRILKIHRGEGLKVLSFFLIAVLLQAGVAIGISTGDALFMSRVGAEGLPGLFIMMPLVMFVFIPFYSHLIEKSGIDRVFTGTLVVLIAGGVLFFYFFSQAGTAGKPLFYGIKLYAYLWMISLYSLFWNFVDEYFDIIDAKRLFPFFSGGLAAGAAIGGALTGILSDLTGIAALFLIWSGAAALTLPVLLITLRKYRKIPAELDSEAKSVIGEIRDVFYRFKSSRYILLINIMMFLLLFLTTLSEYQYLDIFSASRTDVEMATLFGRLFLMANLFNLVVNFFIFNRLIANTGVVNLALLQPLLYTVVMIWFALDYEFEAALAAFFVYQGFMISVDANNWNFLFNAVRQNMKKAVRTFAEGLSDPLATAAAGVFLMYYSEGSLPALTGIAAGAAAVIIALLLRREYRVAMIEVLKSSWLNFSDNYRAILETAGTAFDDNSFLAAAGSGVFTERFEILWHISQKDAVRVLLNRLGGSAYSEQKHYSHLLNFLLEQGDNEIYHQIIRRVEQTGELHPAVTEELGRHALIQVKNVQSYLISDDADRKAAAALAMWHNWQVPSSAMAMNMINEMLDGSREERLAAIRIVGKTGLARFANYLSDFLSDEDYETRLEALRSVNLLSGPAAARLIAPLINRVEEGSEEEQLIAVAALDRIHDTRMIKPLLRLADGFSSAVKREVTEALSRLGLQAVPVVLSVFSDDSYTYAARSLAARLLSQLAFPQFEASFYEIIVGEIETAYLYRLRAHVLRSGKDEDRLNVLEKFYSDSSQNTLNFILEVLTIAGRLPDFELISSALNSPSRRSRGNAIETLEQGVSRPVFKLLLPFYDGRSEEEVIAVYRKNYRAVDYNAESIIRTAAYSQNVTETVIGLQVMKKEMSHELPAALRNALQNNRSRLFNRFIPELVEHSQTGRELTVLNKIQKLGSFSEFNRLDIYSLWNLALNLEQVEIDGPLYKTDAEENRLLIPYEAEVKYKDESFSRIPGFTEVLAGESPAADYSGSGTFLALKTSDFERLMYTYAGISQKIYEELLIS